MTRKSKKGFNYGKVAFYLLIGGVGLGVVNKVVNSIATAKKRKKLAEEYAESKARMDETKEEELLKVAEDLRKFGIPVSESWKKTTLS